MNLLSFLNLGGQEILVILLLFLPLILAISALVQCLTSTFADSTLKLMWVLIILLMPILGTVLWFTIGVRQIKRP